MSFPIDCGSCVLRPWRASDAPVITPLLGDRDVWINLSDRVPHPYELQHAEEFLDRHSKINPPTNVAITLDDKPIGGIGVFPGEGINRVSAEMGYWIGKPYWGKGIGSAALEAMTRYVADNFEFTRIFALVLARNPASARMLEKAGYVREGYLKRSVIKAGVIEDDILYGYYTGR